MKSREKSKKPGQADFGRFAEALMTLENVAECRRFLSDLCTPAELEAMVDRWRAVELLKSGKTYREIAEKTGMSVTTVGRVARCIEFGNDGYETAWQRLANQSSSARQKKSKRNQVAAKRK